MRKVVFKGVINGEEFDNVKDYNEKINDLLSKGTQISARSNTEVVDEPTPVKGVEDDTKEELIETLTPFFNEGDGHYIDSLVTGDKELDSRRLDEVKKKLEESFRNLNKVLDIDNFNIGDALNIMNDYKNIRNEVLEDKYTTESVVDDLKDEIKRAQDKVEVLEGSLPLIDELLDFYSEAFNVLKNWILSNK